MLNTNEGSIKQYLDDIRHTKPLTKEEEQVLFSLVKKGNQKARQRLITSNMRFVLKVAMQYRTCPIPLSDLISEGAIGLTRAIDSFEPERGLKFISYGVWWIKAYITKAINEKANLIRLPVNQTINVRKALKEHSQGKELTDEVKELIQFGQKAVSFDSPLNSDSKTTYSEVLKDDSAINPEIDAEVGDIEELVKDLMAQLPEKEADVIGSIYGISREAPQTLREVGSYMNISHERVRQLRDQALKRLRKNNNKEYLAEKKDAFLTAINS